MVLRGMIYVQLNYVCEMRALPQHFIISQQLARMI